MPLASLPEELLLQILTLLSLPPPSHTNSRQEPSLALTTSPAHPYKSLSRVSSRLRRIILPLLFRHARLRLPHNNINEDVSADILSFFDGNDLGTKIESFTLLVPPSTPQMHQRFPHRLAAQQDPRYRVAAEFWDRLLRRVPGLKRVVIVAPPAEMACWANCAVDLFGDWAFGDMEYHILELSLDDDDDAAVARPLDASELDWVPPTYPSIAPSSIIHLRPWTHLHLNEGSFLAAYGTYEYFERGPPSLTYSIKDCLTRPRHPQRVRGAVPPLPSLRSFAYTAILPFANHCDFRPLLPHLQVLDIQIAPTPESNILHDPKRVGKAELEDCWQELITAYRLITRPFRTFDISSDGKPGLQKFVCRDKRIRALADDLDEEFVGLCLPVWVEDPIGVFTRLAPSAVSA